MALHHWPNNLSDDSLLHGPDVLFYYSRDITECNGTAVGSPQAGDPRPPQPPLQALLVVMPPLAAAQA